jgi:hypothetical protein
MCEAPRAAGSHAGRPRNCIKKGRRMRRRSLAPECRLRQLWCLVVQEANCRGSHLIGRENNVADLHGHDGYS